MKEIQFNQYGNVFVADTECKNDFNLHIELSAYGTVTVYQKTAGEKFALLHRQTSNERVIDVDFDGIIWPKQIKITSTCPTEKCLLTEKS